jgi:hypothetical protein
MSTSCLVDLLDAVDAAISTITRLTELGPALDDGGPVYFPNAIELLALIDQQARHLERLSRQLAACVLPRPHMVEEDQP